MDTVEKVLEAMRKAGKPVNAAALVKLTGLDKKEVEKAMKTLKDGEKIFSPIRCYWQHK
jgi:cytochrome c553